MYRLVIALGSFRGRVDAFLAAEQLKIYLEAHVRANECELRYYPSIPNLYDSGVRYHIDSDDEDDDWCDVITTLEQQFGDCEDLACWYAAECRVRKGLPAYCDFDRRFVDEWVEGRGTVTMDRIHIFVRIAPCPQFPQGTVIDPARDLGMGQVQSNVILAPAADWRGV